jgi:hypothetical protein
MHAKFAALTEPFLGARGDTLFSLARGFGAGSLSEMRAILARL